MHFLNLSLVCYSGSHSHINSNAETKDRSGEAEEAAPPLLCLAFCLRAQNFVPLVPRALVCNINKFVIVRISLSVKYLYLSYLFPRSTLKV